MSVAAPTGQGECRDPIARAGDEPTGFESRTARSEANDRRYGGMGYDPTPKPQDGRGSESMLADVNPAGDVAERIQDIIAPVPDLRALGDPGQTFGGS